MALGGENINTRWTLLGSEEIVRKLRDIGAAGEKAAGDLRSSSATASSALAGVSRATSALQGAFSELSSFVGGAAGPLVRITSALGGLKSGAVAVPAAIAGIVAGLGALAKSGADAADAVRDGAIRIGTSAERYSEFQFALEQSGSRAEGFERAIGVVLEAATKAEEAGKQTNVGADLFQDAAKKFTQSQQEITDLFGKKNQDLADEQRRSVQEIADLTRQKGTAEEEATLQSTRRITDINRQHVRSLNDLIVKRNRDAQQRAAEYNRLIEKSAQTAAEGADKFSKFGVSLLEAGVARDPTKILEDLADKFEAIGDPVGRAAAAVNLFGRRVGPQLVEFLSQGRKGIVDLTLEARRLGVTFSGAQVEVGDKFNDALGKLTGTISRTSQKIGLLFAPAFTSIMEAMAAAFGSAQQPILEALRPIANDLNNLFSGNLGQVQSQFLLAMREAAIALGIAFQAMGVVIGAVMTSLGEGFKLVADVLNAVFGTKLSAVDIPLFVAAVLLGAKAIGILTAAFVALRIATLANPVVAIATAIVVLAAVIAANWGPITEFFTDVMSKLSGFGQSLQEFGAAVAKPFIEAWAEITAAWNDTVKLLSDGLENVKTFFADAIQQIQDAWVAARDFIKTNFIDPVLGFLNAIIETATKVGSAISGALGGGGQIGGTAPGGASGGFVRGPGTGRSDSILARLSNGEMVINAFQTRLFRPLLEAINRGTLSPAALRGLFPGFAAGGLAIAQAGGLGGGRFNRSEIMSRRAPLGGLQRGMRGAEFGRALTLVLGGQRIEGLNASPDAVRELFSLARRQKLNSLGNKPGWFGA